MPSRADLEVNLALVRERIARAAERAGRSPQEIAILAVTKGQPAASVRLAWEFGLRLIGENRVQEAEAKSLEGWPEGVELHLIGHLQRNKAAKAARLFVCVQSIDKLETAVALQRAAEASGRSIDVLLEKNTSGAESQYGYRDAERLLDEAGRICELRRLRVRGLMTIAPLGGDESRLRRAFAELRELLARLQRIAPSADVLSMGMSADYPIAVEEGSTMVRLGTALFGERRGA